MYRIAALLLVLSQVAAFVPQTRSFAGFQNVQPLQQSFDGDAGWTGEVVSNEGGSIKGCTMTQVDGSTTEWTIFIDGVEADLGKFSEVVYKKLLVDAKTQRFQGFRPGTVPPHLLATYKAYTMDEVCRETTSEAMQQNNIKPFAGAREDFEFEKFSIPPPSKKKKGGKKKKKVVEGEEEAPVEEPSWRPFGSMKEAISGGWTPGQSFSFVATSVKGQQLQEGVAPPINPLSGM
mmetsp:Transcript_11844/g.19655  ORF Transcript_11844/g.19655 Transcript_11844/m.19655 type:complete len:233 (-) Transcript_11844:149-847(-)|eukprot:CAMPEP_0119011774 /NCGR_PEP_ID=MMETSP1176-20130426/5882_1 /TAXON_ID=265551 /ORGANISM="Synedropsis recta cf, Strain CCMP1620" /LENGTH=232 /DNA_ID=CAMNT_0006964637 /DNA_START=43 /DNA_END=741 /DNA_ORIENTATION=+